MTWELSVLKECSIMNTKNKRFSYLVYATFLISLFFLFIRAPYGWCFNDEPFIITLAQRLYNGDHLILDEWHPAQVFGPVLLPFYWVFRLFSADNTGILLTFRYIYCVLWWGTCLVVFYVVNKHTNSALTALCAFVYLILFSPLDNMTLSYTSIGLMCCLLLSCIILEVKELSRKSEAALSVILSICATILCLCSPYMAGVYILIIIIAICKRKKKHFKWGENLFRIVRWSGCCSVFFFIIIFLGFVRKEGESWKTYLDCIQMVVEDPDHMNTSILNGLKDCLIQLVKYNYVYSTIIGISIACSLYKKGLRKIRLVLSLLCVLGYLYAVYCYLSNDVYVKFNQQMIDLALLGLVAFALLEEKPWDLFISFTVTGLIYTFMNNLASNTGILSTGMTLSVCGVGSIAYIMELCQELRKQYLYKRRIHFLIPFICAGIMMTQFSSELFTKIIRQYWDEEPAVLTETIQVGAAKGLKTTPERKEEYEKQYEELKSLLDLVEEKEEKRFVSFTASPIVYLDADLKFGTFTA